MVLTFTLAGGVAKADAQEIILGAAGCAVAWGIIDGSIFMLNSLFQKGWRMRLMQQLKEVRQDEAVGILRKEFDERYADVISEPTRELVYKDITESIKSIPVERPTISKDDVMGAVGLVVIEAVCSLFAIIPLIIFGDQWYALRASNVSLLVVLTIVAYYWAGWAGWKGLGRTMITAAICGVGILMVLVAVLLGG